MELGADSESRVSVQTWEGEGEKGSLWDGGATSSDGGSSAWEFPVTTITVYVGLECV